MVLDGEGEASPPVRIAVLMGSGVAAAASVVAAAFATVPAQNNKRSATTGNKGPKKMKQIESFFKAIPVNQSRPQVFESEVNATSSEVLVPAILSIEVDANNLQDDIPQRFNRAEIEPDPGLRKQIEEYATPEIRDEVRRAYISKGACQPKDHDFQHNEDGREFRGEWYKEFDWL